MAFSLKVRMPTAVARVLDSPRLASFFRADYPPVAVEVTPRLLVAAAVERGKHATSLKGHRVVELPPGLVQPSLLRPALAEPETFGALLRSALDGLEGFEGSFSLVLPDRVAKVTFVDLEQGAATLTERAELIRWKLKRTTPFRVEDGRISFQSFPAQDGAIRCLVSLVQEQVVEQFEQVAAALGYHCGLVDLASFNVWNLAHEVLALSGDSLLVNLGEDFLTAIIGRAGEPLFVRCKAVGAGEAAGLEAVCSELNTTVLYYQDRLGGTAIERAVVRAPAAGQADLLAALRSRHGIAAAPLDLARVPGAAGLDAERAGVVAPALGAAMGR